MTIATPRRPCGSGGFTLIELLIVISVLVILTSIATPAMMSVIRKNAVQEAANEVHQLWRMARLRAMREMPPAPVQDKVAHYGVAIVQQSGVPLYAELIKAAKPDDSSLDSNEIVPNTKVFFNRNVSLAWQTDAGISTDMRTVIWYAQYGTGLPIDAKAVTDVKGDIATPVGVGVRDALRRLSRFGGQTYQLLRFQTLDFAPQQGSLPPRGTASEFAVYHSGLAYAEEVR